MAREAFAWAAWLLGDRAVVFEAQPPVLFGAPGRVENSRAASIPDLECIIEMTKCAGLEWIALDGLGIART